MHKEQEFMRAKYSEKNIAVMFTNKRDIFEAGFRAGLDYAQRKPNTYAAYVAGKITLKELEEVINA